jgi:hypothetical protein
MWCDSVEHRKWQCAEMNEALANGLIRMNEANRVANAATGHELPGMTGRGGMKAFFAAAATQPAPNAGTPAPPTPASTFRSTTNTISLGVRPTATIGGGTSVHLVTIHDDGSETHEIIDADVDVKRKADDNDPSRRVRFKFDAMHRADSPQTPSPPSTSVPFPTMDRSTSPPTVPATIPATGGPPLLQTIPATSPAPTGMPNLVDLDMEQGPADIPMQDATARERRFRLASELRESISIAEIGEKIMNMPIHLTLKELMATAPDLSNHFHEITRKRRIPVPGATPIDPVVISTATASSVTRQPLYACPSGRVKALVEDSLVLSALLDNGSEINLMPRRVWERLDQPIDTTINWSLDGFKKSKEQDSKTVLGVCHDVKVSIGGVESQIPIFVVDDANADLLLGRPWEMAVRATYINEEDGSYSCIIKNDDGTRIVRFCAMKADHERIRMYARPQEKAAIGGDWLKA